MKLTGLGDDLLPASHHLDIERRRILRRERNQRRRVAVPVAEVAVDDRPGVVGDRAVVAAAIPPLLERLRKLVDVVDLIDRDALVGQMEHLIVEVGVEIPLPTENLLHPVIPPPGPMVRAEHHDGLLAEAVEGNVDVLRPIEGVAHKRAAERVEVVERGTDVLGDPQSLHVGDVGVHLRRGLGVGRVLENHPHAVHLDLLDVLLHDVGRGDQARRAAGDGVAEALGDVAIRAHREEHAILIEHSPIHGVAGEDVLRDRVGHEIAGSEDLHFAGTNVGLVHHAPDAPPVVAVGVRIDDRRDRQSLAFMLLEHLPGGPHRIRGDKAVEHDPSRLAADERGLGEVDPADLVDPGNDLVKTVVVVELADAVHRRMDRVELVPLVEKLEPRHVPGHAAGVVLDLHPGHAGDQAASLLVEVAGVAEGERLLRLPQHLLRELRRSLPLGVEMSGCRGGGGRGDSVRLPGHVGCHRERRKALHELTTGGHGRSRS